MDQSFLLRLSIYAESSAYPFPLLPILQPLQGDFQQSVHLTMSHLI